MIAPTAPTAPRNGSRDLDEPVIHRSSSSRAATDGSSSPFPAVSRSAMVRAVIVWRPVKYLGQVPRPSGRPSPDSGRFHGAGCFGPTKQFLKPACHGFLLHPEGGGGARNGSQRVQAPPDSPRPT